MVSVSTRGEIGVRQGSFEGACRAALSFLRSRIPMALWMVTRANGADWVVLVADDEAYGVREGASLPWRDTFCYRMVEGQGPSFSPSIRDVPAYASAPAARMLEVGAYVGLPILEEDGSLFGTLCAIHPEPMPPDIVAEQQLVEMIAELLSATLWQELRADREQRRAEQAEAKARVDDLSGLVNRRAWDDAMVREEARCQRYGDPAGVIVVDLDGLKLENDLHGHAAGDALIRATGEALAAAVRGEDLAARLGGDEFGVLAVRCTAKELDALTMRVRSALASAGVEASVGASPRDTLGGLHAAWRSADWAMYREKRARPWATKP